MRRIPSKYLSQLEKTPAFVAAVTAARQSGESVIENLDNFADDPFLLYTALWFAYSEGVEVRFQPSQSKPGASKVGQKPL